jgi:hypothetical protein
MSGRRPYGRDRGMREPQRVHEKWRRSRCPTWKPSSSTAASLQPWHGSMPRFSACRLTRVTLPPSRRAPWARTSLSGRTGSIADPAGSSSILPSGPDTPRTCAASCRRRRRRRRRRRKGGFPESVDVLIELILCLPEIPGRDRSLCRSSFGSLDDLLKDADDWGGSVTLRRSHDAAEPGSASG